MVWIWYIYRQGSVEYYFEYWSQLLYFFGLLSRWCIFMFFIFSTVFLGPILFSRSFSKQSSSSLLYRA